VYATAAPAVPTPSAAPVPGQDAGFTAQDVTFMEQMITHHSEAIRLTTIALAHTADPGIRQIADGERGAALTEVQQMSDWLFSIGIKPPVGDDAAVHSHGGGMTEADVNQLDTMSGAAFDARFLDLLTQHSLGALPIAQDEARGGANAGATELAGQIARRESDQVTRLATRG
jgi:uncharacterized protein (DUF305 family)